MADVFELITKKEIQSIYYQDKNGQLFKADDTHWYLKMFATTKWFKREVIE
nr:hypothetical protein [Bacillus pacificus]